MKRKNSLVLTSIKKNFDKTNNNILIGEWCLFDKTKKKYNYFDIKEKNTFNDPQNEKKCNFYYERLLEDVKNTLKNELELNWNTRSWEIFIGPWLHRYVAIMFEKYYSMEKIFKKFKISKIRISKNYDFNLICQDHKQFKDFLQTDEWNLKLFTKIYYKYFFKRNIILVETNKQEKPKKFKKNNFYQIDLITNIKSHLLNFFFSKVNIFTKKIYYKPHINNKFFLILSNIINFNLPFKYNFDYKLLHIKYLNNFRKKKINTKFKLNKFEKILREMFFELLPFYYLEQVSNLKYLSNKLFLPDINNKNVYTGLGIYQENIFKFWLCNAVSNGSKLFIFQHGNNYGSTKILHSEYLEKRVADKFFSWGWKDKNKKIHKFFCQKLIGKKKFDLNRSNKILVVGGVVEVYKPENTTGNLYGARARIYIKVLKNLISSLKYISKNKVHFRPHPSEENQRIKIESFVKNINNIKILNSKSDYLDAIKKFELIIFADDSTSFLETLSLNKPCLLLMDKKLYKDCIRKNAIPFYNKLKKVKIIHENPKSLNRFLTGKKDNINEWWFDRKTQRARNLFCSNFCNYASKTISSFNKI